MTVERRVHRSRMAVKMNQPVKKKPSTESVMRGSIALAASVWYGPPAPTMFQLGVSMMPYAIQKPP